MSLTDLLEHDRIEVFKEDRQLSPEDLSSMSVKDLLLCRIKFDGKQLIMLLVDYSTLPIADPTLEEIRARTEHPTGIFYGIGNIRFYPRVPNEPYLPESSAVSFLEAVEINMQNPHLKHTGKCRLRPKT